jgi:hypothetical protein
MMAKSWESLQAKSNCLKIRPIMKAALGRMLMGSLSLSRRMIESYIKTTIKVIPLKIHKLITIK